MTKIIEQWNTKTVGGDARLNLDNYELISDNINLQKTNFSALEVVDLIGRVTNNRSNSGPIPNTGTTAYFQATNSGTKYNIFAPGVGEVWLLGPCSFQLSGPSGSVTVEQWLYANDNIDGTKRRVLVANASSSSSSYATLYEGGPNTPVHVDERGYVAVEATGTFTSVQFYLNLIRVR